jgi:hypothetical protein
VRWRPVRAVHDPEKMIADLAAAVALGGDCLADISVLRSQPELAGGRRARRRRRPGRVDIDATIVTSCSEKDQAAPTRSPRAGVRFPSRHEVTYDYSVPIYHRSLTVRRRTVLVFFI